MSELSAYILWDVTEGKGFTQGSRGCGSRRKRPNVKMQFSLTVESFASLSRTFTVNTDHGNKLCVTNTENEWQKDMKDDMFEGVCL